MLIFGRRCSTPLSAYGVTSKKKKKKKKKKEEEEKKKLPNDLGRPISYNNFTDKTKWLCLFAFSVLN